MSKADLENGFKLFPRGFLRGIRNLILICSKPYLLKTFANCSIIKGTSLFGDYTLSLTIETIFHFSFNSLKMKNRKPYGKEIKMFAVFPFTFL